LPIFLLAFAGIYYEWRLYSTKFELLNDARDAAWNFALNNCEGRKDEDTKVESEGGLMGAISGAGGGGAPADVPGMGGLSNFALRKVTVTRKKSIPLPGILGAGANWDVQAEEVFACNEKNMDGDLLSIAKQRWKLKK
jgi:hypothetical protein